MKRTMFFLAFAAIAFTACNKEEMPVAHEGVEVTLTATIADPEPTKSTYEYDAVNKVLKCNWEEKDQISVVSCDPSTYKIKHVDTFTASSVNGKSATFTGTYSGSEGDLIKVYYPAMTVYDAGASMYFTYDATNSNNYSCTVNSEFLNCNWPYIFQSANDDYSHLSFYDSLQGMGTFDGVTISADLKKCVNIIRMEIDLSELALGTTIYSVGIGAYKDNGDPNNYAFTGGTCWAYAYKNCNWDGGSYNNRGFVCLGTKESTPVGCSGLQVTSDKLVVYYPNLRQTSVGAGGSLMIFARDIYGNIIASKSCTFESGVKFTHGYIYDLKAKLEVL